MILGIKLFNTSMDGYHNLLKLIGDIHVSWVNDIGMGILVELVYHLKL